MQSASFIYLLIYSVFIACVGAKNCCFRTIWPEINVLETKWNDTQGVARCILRGSFPPGSKCSVENSKDANGNIQALTSVYFGSNPYSYNYRLGIDTSSCKSLPDDKFKTGWEGFGAYLFKDSVLDYGPVEDCDAPNAFYYG
ncbi:hypothetical protein LY78DRAFT_449356 [Colletotrichum sublineola]|uniref:Secreted protein n=1 Tax=Colletotrichum sublineola TaxID=1173701 RepID=A0A066XLN1_COLSU|nr:hypothetical protein LY78DRAFT_449356 [Colletotrichum sublineola]KDN66636.1 hypothetical protein CSUB01_11775 [Colletotrichum sublineola]